MGSRVLFRGSPGFSPTSGRFSGLDGSGVTPSMLEMIDETVVLLDRASRALLQAILV